MGGWASSSSIGSPSFSSSIGTPSTSSSSIGSPSRSSSSIGSPSTSASSSMASPSTSTSTSALTTSVGATSTAFHLLFPFSTTSASCSFASRSSLAVMGGLLKTLTKCSWLSCGNTHQPSHRLRILATLLFHFSALILPQFIFLSILPSPSKTCFCFKACSNNCRYRQACRTPLVEDEERISLMRYMPIKLAELVSDFSSSSFAGVSSPLISLSFLRSGFADVNANGFSIFEIIAATTSSAPRPACDIAKAVTRATSPFRNFPVLVGSRESKCVNFAFSRGLR